MNYPYFSEAGECLERKCKHEKLVPLLRAGTVTGPGSEALYPLPAAPELHCSLRAAARVPWTAAGPGLPF